MSTNTPNETRSDAADLSLRDLVRSRATSPRLGKASDDDVFAEVTVSRFLEGDAETTGIVRKVSGMKGKSTWDELVQLAEEASGRAGASGRRRFGVVPTHGSDQSAALHGIRLADLVSGMPDGVRLREVVEAAEELAEATLYDAMVDRTGLEAALRDVPELERADVEAVSRTTAAAVAAVLRAGRKSSAQASFGLLDDDGLGGVPLPDPSPSSSRATPPEAAVDDEDPASTLEDPRVAEVSEAFAALPEGLRTVAQARYPLDGSAAKAVSVLAKEMGRTPQRIYQIEKKVVAQLREGTSGAILRRIAAQADPALADAVAREGRTPARADSVQQRILDTLPPVERTAFLVVHGTLAAWSASTKLPTATARDAPEADVETGDAQAPEASAVADALGPTDDAEDAVAGEPVEADHAAEASGPDDAARFEPVPPTETSGSSAEAALDRLPFLDDYDGPPSKAEPTEDVDGSRVPTTENDRAFLEEASPGMSRPIPYDRILPYAGLDVDEDRLARLAALTSPLEPRGYVRNYGVAMAETHAARLHAASSSLPLLFSPVGLALHEEQVFGSEVTTYNVLQTMRAHPHLFGQLYDDLWYAVGPESFFDRSGAVRPVMEPYRRSIRKRDFEAAGSKVEFLHPRLAAEGPRTIDGIKEILKEKFRSDFNHLQTQIDESVVLSKFSPSHWGPSGTEAAVEIVDGIDSKVAWGYAVARRSGVPFGWYRSWTPLYESRLCAYADKVGDEALLSSLLSVADPSAWSTPDSEDWEERAPRDANWSIPDRIAPTMHGARSRLEAGDADRLVAALVHLVAYGSFGWVQARRVRGGGKIHRIGCGLLAILAAIGAVEVPEAWSLPHRATPDAPRILASLMEELGHAGVLGWDAGIPNDLLVGADASRLEGTWIDRTEFEAMVAAAVAGPPTSTG